MARCMLFASGLPLYFWGDAVEYVTYVLNRSSCSANPKRMAPIETLTGVVPNLADVVIFGSPCTTFRDPGKKTRRPRAQVGMIVGKNDETKSFKVYLPKGRIVVTTQHIQSVETLNNQQNDLLQAQLEHEDPSLRPAPTPRKNAARGNDQPIGTPVISVVQTNSKDKNVVSKFRSRKKLAKKVAKTKKKEAINAAPGSE
ncbi:Copia LTR rider [Phytophthora megakarya]|uniref:Copia LTR rider n=1 Tax=Phytophthora megakarya TaxID=4795 RepID=A0A225WT74_9STRA|nr:Copia LTR rider [Phytophthora megakarya]